MRDEDFQYFIAKFGEPTFRVEPDDESFTKWRGKLPHQLLTYWKTEGWCSYKNGLFWTVNPDDYEDIVDEWLEDTPIEQVDSFHAFGRSAFGDLFLCGEVCGNSVTINCKANAVVALAKDLKRKTVDKIDSSIRNFFCLKFNATI